MAPLPPTLVSGYGSRVRMMLRQTFALISKNVKMRLRGGITPMLVEMLGPMIIAALLMGMFFALSVSYNKSSYPIFGYQEVPSTASYYQGDDGIRIGPSSHPSLKNVIASMNVLDPSMRIETFKDTKSLMYDMRGFVQNVWAVVYLCDGAYVVSDPSTIDADPICIANTSDTTPLSIYIRYNSNRVSRKDMDRLRGDAYVPSTSRVYSDAYSNMRDGTTMYIRSGVLSLQNLVVMATAMTFNDSVPVPHISVRRAQPPDSSPEKELFTYPWRILLRRTELGSLFPIVTSLTLLFSLYMITPQVISERENGMLHLLRVSGMTYGPYVISYIVSHIIFMAPPLVAVTWLFTVSGMMEITGMWLMFTVLLCAGVSFFLLCVIMLAWSRRDDTVGLVAVGIILSLNVLSFGQSIPLAAAVLSPFSFNIIYNEWLLIENDIDTRDPKLLTLGYWLLAFNTALYTIVVYMMYRRRDHVHDYGVVNHGALMSPSSSTAIIEFRDVCVRYGDVFALRDVNMSLHSDEIVGLLGRNGAGKTTAVSVATGGCVPTSGVAMFRGVPVSREALSGFVGFCPQKDIFWESLTVSEHLYIFGVLRNVVKCSNSVSKVIHDVDLDDSRHKQARHLSGGLRRRLSLGMTYIGDPPVVFLDEPSSSVDPLSRRSLWDIISKHKTGRCTVLTTHYMNEVDRLADRLLFVESGKIKYSSYPIEFKSSLGRCLDVSVVLGDGDDDGPARRVIAALEHHGSSTLNKGTVTWHDDKLHTIITASLPSDVDPNQMLSDLNDDDVSHVQIETQSMEEGFIKAVSDDVITTVAYTGDVIDTVSISRSRQWYNRLSALCRKCVISAIKSKGAIAGSILTPLMLLLLGLVLCWRFNVFELPAPPLELNLDHIYRDDDIYATGDGDSLDDLLSMNHDVFIGQHNTSNITQYEHMLGQFDIVSLSNVSLSISPRALHGAPALMSAYCQVLMNVSGISRQLHVWHQPIRTSALSFNTQLVLFFGLLAGVGYTILPAVRSATVVTERITGFKTLTYVAGASPLTYWLSHIITEFLFGVILGVCCSILLGVSERRYFYDGGVWCLVLLVHSLYGLAASSRSWILTWRAARPYAATGASIWIEYLLLYSFLVSITSVLASSDASSPAGFILYVLWCVLSPTFCIVISMMLMYDFRYLRTRRGDDTVYDLLTNYEKLATPLLCLCGHFILNAIIIYSLEVLPVMWSKARRPRANPMSPPATMSRDVRLARDTATIDDAVFVEELGKVYGSSVAIENVQYSVPYGETFGLIGLNGSGKTTSLKIMAAMMSPSYGRVLICGSKADVHSHIGWCPQVDALLPHLTVHQHLRLFESLVFGVDCDPYARDTRSTADLLSVLGLSLHLNKMSSQLSGGWKRKLSLAIALLGEPDVLMVDEASSGMDPIARRSLWNVLEQTNSNRSTLLTTHNLDETQALCHRIAIMKSGRIVYVGTPGSFCCRYASGLFVDILYGDVDVDISEVMNKMANCTPVLKNRRRALYHVVDNGLKPSVLSNMLTKLNGMVKENQIVAYSVSQPNMEEALIYYIMSLV